MKKILFAALAALAITSCSQNEIDGIDNGTPKSKNGSTLKSTFFQKKFMMIKSPGTS